MTLNYQSLAQESGDFFKYIFYVKLNSIEINVTLLVSVWLSKGLVIIYHSSGINHIFLSRRVDLSQVLDLHSFDTKDVVR